MCNSQSKFSTMEKITDVSLEPLSAEDSLRASITEKITHMHIANKSPTVEDNRHRLEHVFPTVSDQGLEEGFKRVLEETCCEEIPAYKKQKKKESWAFHEPAKVFKSLPLIMESSTSEEINPNALAGLTGDNRRAKISKMLEEAAVTAHAVGNLDPEPESLPNGRRRYQRRNSFVIYRNLNNTGMFPAVAPSTTKITHPFTGIQNEENAVLGKPPRESNMFFRRRSLPGTQSPNKTDHSKGSSNPDPNAD
jgi:hypothetical protein